MKGAAPSERVECVQCMERLECVEWVERVERRRSLCLRGCRVGHGVPQERPALNLNHLSCRSGTLRRTFAVAGRR